MILTMNEGFVLIRNAQHWSFNCAETVERENRAMRFPKRAAGTPSRSQTAHLPTAADALANCQQQDD
jgi:hypothetical protein